MKYGKIIRTIFWIFFVGGIGGFLSAKTAIIKTEDIITGFMSGGAIGYFISVLLNMGQKAPEMLKGHKIHEGKGIQSSIIIDSNVIIDTFDPKSPNYEASFSFMEYILKNKVLFAMPMHGWFEINCTLNRIQKQKGIVPPIIAGKQSMMMELIHIDAQFLENYASVDVPVIKAMDHLFLVVAKKNNLPLVTWDQQMTTAGKGCGTQVYNPKEWMTKYEKDK